MSSTPVSDLAASLARFGLTEFRPGQQEVIGSILAGQDCLCIMPTGGGKSLCFQLPAVLRPGVVVVISPLIALMKDQVDALHRQGVRATCINSSLDPSEQRRRLGELAAGQYDLVYVAPERLRSARFLEILGQIQVQLLAVDEAHCISEWGHDFRPDYARIGRFRERIGNPQTIALTATATADVRRDVLVQLQLQSPAVFITGFARPNLRFECYEPESTRDKDERLLALLQDTEGSALVYAATRKRCEELVKYLDEHLGRRVEMYHAGLLPDDRRRVQDEFMSGEIPVIVATNAFGMGIDKRDLRLVVHYNIPGTIEAYYQEAGRAGRDGKPARCVLLFSYSDRYVQEFFIENRYPPRETVKQVYEFLRRRPEDPIELTLQQIKEELGLSITSEGVGTCEQLLEKCGAIERLDSQQNQASVKIDSSLPTLVDMLPREAKVRRRVLRALEAIVEDRRGEWVFFSLPQLATKLELDREALTRAIRELQQLSAFDYLPPFRGRAIKLLQRDTPFGKLKIDFAEMTRRQSLDQEKLERVIRYAQTRKCRQWEILDYFGDPEARPCQACDNCRPQRGPSVIQPPSEHATDAGIVEAVRIVLSGAARARERIGKELLALMLTKSNSARISKLGLDRLSTYGLLADLRKSDVSELIDAIIEAKLLAYVDLDRFRAVLSLTELGKRVMHGSESLPRRFVLAKPLLLRLKGRRLTAAKRSVPQETIPPATIPPATTPARNHAPESDLPAIGSDASSPGEHAGAPPDSLAASASVPSFAPFPPTRASPEPGSSRTEERTRIPVGGTPEDSDALAEGTDDDGHFPEGAAEDWLSPPLDPLDRPTHYWTWRLLFDGYSAPVCRAIRGLDETSFIEHLLRAIEDGHDVDLDWFLSSDQQRLLAGFVESVPGARSRTDPPHLPPGLTPLHVQIFRRMHPDRTD